MEMEDVTASKDTTSIPDQTDVENTSNDIVAVVDVHVDAPVVKKFMMNPKGKYPKQKGAKSSSKVKNYKNDYIDETHPGSFDVITEKELAEWYRKN